MQLPFLLFILQKQFLEGVGNTIVAMLVCLVLNLVNIDSSAFRSRRLTKQIAESADLILCYEKKHCAAVSQLAPAKMRQTFLLPDFANLCQYCSQAGMLDRYYTVESRIRAVIASAFTVRPMVSVAEDIPDPKYDDQTCFFTLSSFCGDGVCGEIA